jgi:glycosyltransferase involved in cell wall biosynthesis
MPKIMKLAIITTHPIQYYAPIFKLLHERKKIEIKVFYTWGKSAQNKYDPDFDKNIAWDIPLLDTYPFDWVENKATKQGSHHFNGIITPQLINQINNYGPNAVLVIGWAYHSHLKVIRYFKNKVPVFFRGDSTLLDEKHSIRSILKSIFLKWVYRHIDHAFYNGINNKAYFKKYDFKEDQLSFAPHAVDNERFALSRVEEAEQLKQSLGIPSTAIVILFAGKLEEKKDPQLLLDAFIQLNSPNLHLIFTGNGQLENTLKLKANGHKNTHFISFQNQSYMPVVYQVCDIFCLPSKGPGESWGLAVNEAMACKKAVLVSDKCGCAIDLVEDKKNGAIFKSGNLNDLTHHLKQLIQSKEKLSIYGNNSSIIIEPWSFLNVAKAIENKLLHEADISN